MLPRPFLTPLVLLHLMMAPTAATYVTDANISTAVAAWRADPAAAEASYGHIGTWDTSDVTTMAELFLDCDTNEDISVWNTAQVTSMYGMFRRATYFNQPIGEWDVSKVTDMGGMFERASSFNQNIGSWDVSKVTNMEGMFQDAAAFNQNLSNWKIESVHEERKESIRTLRDFMSFKRWKMEERNYPIFGLEVREKEKKEEITTLFERKKELEQQIKKKEEKKEEIGNDVKALKVLETILNRWSESDPELYKTLVPTEEYKGGNRKTKKNKNSKRKTRKRFIKKINTKTTIF